MRPAAPGSLIGNSGWHLERSFAAQLQTSRDARAQRPAWWIGTQPLGLERHRHTGGVIDMSSSR